MTKPFDVLTYSFSLPYPNVSGNTATRHALGRHYKAKGSSEYDSLVGEECHKQLVHGLMLKGPLAVAWVVAPPDDKARDEDNLRKVVQDALTKAKVWVDDSNKVIRSTLFNWHEPEPEGYIMITIGTR